MSDTRATEVTRNGDAHLAQTVLGGLLADLEVAGTHLELRPLLERARTRLYESESCLDVAAALASLEDAHRVLGQARQLATEGGEPAGELARLLPRLEQIVIALHDAHVQREIARDRSRPAPTRLRRTFRSSAGVPNLHDIERRVLPASLTQAMLPPLDAALEDRDDALEEDGPSEVAPDDDRPARRRLPLASALPSEALEWRELSRLARDRLEEIAISSHLRRPTTRHYWTVAVGYEARLLENLDALVALGIGPFHIDVVDSAIDYAAEIQSLDVGRVFARAFVLGCISGADAADLAVASLSATHATTRAALVDALSLASNVDIARSVRAALLREHVPNGIASLLEILRRRGETDVATSSAFVAHPSPTVRSEAARGLGLLPDGSSAVERLLEAVLERQADSTTRLAVAEALAIRGSRRGIAAAREGLDSARDPNDVTQWARLVALIGDLSDLERLVAAGARVPVALASLGWLGHRDAVPHLIAALMRERVAPRPVGGEGRVEEARLACALDRILGGDLVDTLVGDDRLGNATTAPTTDPERWRSQLEIHVRQRTGSDEAPRKMRFGEAWTPRASLDELESPSSFSVERSGASLELSVALGPAGSVDTATWVAKQELSCLAVRQTPGLDAHPGLSPGKRPRAT